MFSECLKIACPTQHVQKLSHSNTPRNMTQLCDTERVVEIQPHLLCFVFFFKISTWACLPAFLLVFSCTVLEYHIWFLVFFLRSWLAGRDPTLWPSCLGLWIWRGDWSWRTQKHIRWWEKIIGYRCEWYCGSYFVMDLHFRSQSSVCFLWKWGEVAQSCFRPLGKAFPADIVSAGGLMVRMGSEGCSGSWTVGELCWLCQSVQVAVFIFCSCVSVCGICVLWTCLLSHKDDWSIILLKVWCLHDCRETLSTACCSGTFLQGIF